MRILTYIPEELSLTPEQVASECRRKLFDVVGTNVRLMKAAAAAGRPYPDLYESGIWFIREPWAGRFEEFATADRMIERGWADCDDCVAYRCAQYQCRGGSWLKTGIKIYWRFLRDGKGRRLTMHHAQVRLPDGTIEDPSRRLPGG